MALYGISATKPQISDNRLAALQSREEKTYSLTVGVFIDISLVTLKSCRSGKVS